MDTTDEPQPISLEDAQRIWTLQKQKASLSQRDIDLLHQAAEWQMWVSDGIRLRSGKPESKHSSDLDSVRAASAA
ncbi:MAG TPA: hypothetical protein PLA50_09275 [Bacteroidia bacterium]|nr:hypothetical protein [Bacteroidia bacterium]